MTDSDDADGSDRSPDADTEADSSRGMVSFDELTESITQDRSDSADAEPDLNLDLDLEGDAQPAETQSSFDFGLGDLTDKIRSDSTDSVAELSGTSHILFLGPVQGERCDRPCVNLLAHFADSQSSVLFITLTDTPDHCLATWRQHSESFPAHLCILSGEDDQASDSETTISFEDGPAEMTLKPISDPSDLTRLGIMIEREFTALTGDARPVVVCFRSLTALIQYVSPDRVFKFLRVLVRKLDATHTVAHYHLDPDAHDTRTVQRFRSLFDTVVRITPDDEFEILDRS